MLLSIEYVKIVVKDKCYFLISRIRLSVLVLCMLRRRAFSTPAYIYVIESEESKKAGEKVREAQRLYVHNTYIQKEHIHQLGVTKTGELENEDENQSI